MAKRLAAGHPAVEARVLGEVAELASVLAGGRHRHAVDRRAAGRGAGQAGQDLEGGRLAGAVRAEKAEHRPGRHVEGQVRESLDTLVMLGQVAHRDGAGHRLLLCCDWLGVCLSSLRASARRAIRAAPASAAGSARTSRGGCREDGARGAAWRTERRSGDRDLRHDQRALSRGAGDRDAAAEHGNPVLQAADPGAARRIGAADAVVANLDVERRSTARRADARLGCRARTWRRWRAPRRRRNTPSPRRPTRASDPASR